MCYHRWARVGMYATFTYRIHVHLTILLVEHNKGAQSLRISIQNHMGHTWLYSNKFHKNFMHFDSPPANVLSVSVILFIPFSGLPGSPINLTALTYTLYTVYGLRL